MPTKALLNSRMRVKTTHLRPKDLLHPTSWRRNLGTAAIMGAAASGGIISPACLAGTAGGCFIIAIIWRARQMKIQAKQKTSP